MKKKYVIFLKGLFAAFLIGILAQSCQEKIDRKNLKILVIGNSITRHGPSESIGWYGDWGMAASSIDSDYVHVLKRKLEGLGANVTVETVGNGWERDFNYDFSKEKLTEFNADILIVRLGENVPKVTENYEPALIELIKKFKFKHAIITGNFWSAHDKDSVQQKVAIHEGYEYVDMSDMWADDSYKAFGKFDDGGVAIHPGDKGMEKIADKLVEAIKPLLK